MHKWTENTLLELMSSINKHETMPHIEISQKRGFTLVTPKEESCFDYVKMDP